VDVALREGTTAKWIRLAREAGAGVAQADGALVGGDDGGVRPEAGGGDETRSGAGQCALLIDRAIAARPPVHCRRDLPTPPVREEPAPPPAADHRNLIGTLMMRVRP
jgi:hypothetical protein